MPSGTAMVRKNGGWFAGLDAAPEVPPDYDVVTDADLDIYATGLEKNSFFGPNSWYMNHEANAAYFSNAPAGGELSMPALFLHARYDYTCETLRSRLAEPMRELCLDLTEATVDTGHWMAQEAPWVVNREIARWLFARLPNLLD